MRVLSGWILQGGMYQSVCEQAEVFSTSARVSCMNKGGNSGRPVDDLRGFEYAVAGTAERFHFYIHRGQIML